MTAFGYLDVFFEFFIVGLGEVPAVMNSPAFTTRSGRLRHKQANREHILAHPSFGRIENLIHYITLPEADNFLGLRERLIRSGNADVSPHKRPERIGYVFCIQTGTGRMRDIKFN